MSERGRQHRSEPVGAEKKLARLERIGRLLMSLDRELEANQREYDDIVETRAVLVAEHDRLRRKLLWEFGQDDSEDD